MLIYIEGPAGAGKTSFVRLAKEQSPDDFEVLEEYVFDEDESSHKGYATFLKNTEAKLEQINDHSIKAKNLLVDRGHLSMMVNAFVEQNYGFNSSFDKSLEWYQSRRDIGDLLLPDLYVYITAPVDLILERAHGNGWYREDLGWTRDPQLAMDTYEVFFNELEKGVPVLRLDGARDSSDLISELNEYLGNN